MTNRRPRFNRTTALCSLLLGAAAPVFAGFQYAGSGGRDLVVGFRQAGGSFELVVNAGSVSNLYALPAGTRITITNLTAGLLSATFPDLNNLSWSASADMRVSGDANYPVQTLWVTRARADFNAQSTAWVRQSSLTQGTAGGKISGIGDNAVVYGGQVPTDAQNTATAVVIPAGSIYGYGQFIGASGNFSGTFQGNVEATTAPDFDTAGQSLRADFYELKPGSGNGTYLGFFEFSPAGVLTYTAGASSATLPRPSITNLTRNGTTNTISFTTANAGQYRLRYTNSAGLATPVTNWPVSGTAVAGNGGIRSLSDTTSDTQRFYALTATP